MSATRGLSPRPLGPGCIVRRGIFAGRAQSPGNAFSPQSAALTILERIPLILAGSVAEFSGIGGITEVAPFADGRWRRFLFLSSQLEAEASPIIDGASLALRGQLSGNGVSRVHFVDCSTEVVLDSLVRSLPG